MRVNPVRFLTAAALFDGHDAAINVIRRVLQDQGAEVIHLGHNRSVHEIAKAALEEDVDAIAISSYQGGHNEFFCYLFDTLKTAGAGHIRIFGGGGGVILPEEIEALHRYGIARIYSPDDGFKLGLEGMAKEMVEQALKARAARPQAKVVLERTVWGRTLTALENGAAFNLAVGASPSPSVVLGITGTGGAGKSSLTDELVLRFLHEFSDISIVIYSLDPSKKKTGGALLGDRIRMNSLDDSRVFMRSLATRGAREEIVPSLSSIVAASRAMSFDVIIVETPGIGQGASAITEVSDVSLYVMTSEYGAATQLEKIDMIDLADFIAINKFDRRGSDDALREVRKQYRRSHKCFHEPADERLPIFGTRCNVFNDKGVTSLYRSLRDTLGEKNPRLAKGQREFLGDNDRLSPIVPPERHLYLTEIAKTVRDYKESLLKEAEKARKAQALLVASQDHDLDGFGLDRTKLKTCADKQLAELSSQSQEVLRQWEDLRKRYQAATVIYKVRGKDLEVPQRFETLSGSSLKRVTLPSFVNWDQIILFCGLENIPGRFPFVGGIYPFKRTEEEPRRQFAGEGSPARTNQRFHFLSRNDRAKRLSTAFDSVTLYGEDPAIRPDIYGKVGESGVSVATLEDMKILYQGFDLCDPMTSVSMTINGPAPMILAFYLMTAIHQAREKIERDKGRALTDSEFDAVKRETLKQIRGTVQADILKEDQAQNTCIFSTEFALRMMADVQEYFIENGIRNYYSVSISGYHIAEAGANPITQLAFTLANGFTYVEYFRARGMKVDDFAPNLSFFFSNGLDAEYSVIGRVARRIWAVAMKNLYGANERSQMLKYHIQTSGRSLHAAEIEFNDIRTTLQALTAIYDNCNSLHTNAYDEAITTPTEESVRRAMAIQMIIQGEFGNSRTENILQGSYVIQELTDLVEEAVLSEFERLSLRGGVLGAMEMQYQRSKIQDESLLYEKLKHSGDLKVVGVNTFIPEAGAVRGKIPLARSNESEKNSRLRDVEAFRKKNENHSKQALDRLKQVALQGGNIFAELVEAAQVCSLGEMSKALYEVGGRYRRNV